MTTSRKIDQELSKLDGQERRARERFERELHAVRKRAAAARSSAPAATVELQELQDRLSELAGPAPEGDEPSEKELASLEEEIDAQKRRWRLAETAAQQYERQATELGERQRETERDLLEKRYDAYAKARRAQAERVEGLTQELRSELAGLLELVNEQRPIAQALGMRDGRSYHDILEHRLTSALGGFLPSSRHWILMDQTLLEVDPHVRSLAEQRAANEESLRRTQALEEQQLAAREARARRGEIERRRAQLRVDYGWDKEVVTTQERQRINALVDAKLREEFPGSAV